jgi:hypothetical protein
MDLIAGKEDPRSEFYETWDQVLLCILSPFLRRIYMALIYKGVPCSLCYKEIDIDQPFFASSDFCSAHSDAPIHWQCLWAWDEVDEFLNRFHESEIERYSPEHWTIIEKNKDFFITTDFKCVCVHIACAGQSWNISIKKWPDSLRSKFTKSLNVSSLPEERRVIAGKVIEEIIENHPKITK